MPRSIPLVKPFRGLRPASGRAEEVAAPPYDVLNSAEARQLAKDKPYSFLHISKPEIDLPEDTDPYADIVYETAAKNLRHMIDEGIMVRDDAALYYVYRLIWKDRAVTGIVGAASVADYDTNRIRKHEFTRPVKENDRVRQIEAVGGQTGPVMLIYPDAPQIDDLMRKTAQQEPEVDIVAESGVRHMIWPMRDTADIEALTAAFDALDNLYIADGHHRSAAASRVSAARIAAGDDAPDASHRHFLSVIFPHHEMQILDYNRVIKDLNGHSPSELLDRISQYFDIGEQHLEFRPTRHGEFGMYMEGKWYRLNIDKSLIPSDDPVKKLDVSLLHDNLIEPFLGISDPRKDDRIDFVGGIRGLGELSRRVLGGEMAIAFALYPTTVEDLMSVADADQVMPPKSTWFEPKLADGLVSHILD